MIGGSATTHYILAFLALNSRAVRAAEPLIASMCAKESVWVLLEAPLDAVLSANSHPGLRDDQGGKEQQY